MSVKLSITFRKGEAARFLSHLDLMATMEYAIRRAGLPVALSEGFNPRLKMSIAAPLNLGYVGEREIMELVLSEAVPPEEICARLGAALPPGITVLSVHEVTQNTKSAASRLDTAIYRVDLPAPQEDLSSRVRSLLARDTLPVEEHWEGKVRARDMRPLIAELAAPSSQVLRIVARLDGKGSIRPEYLLDALNIPRDGARIIRESITIRD